MAQQEPIKGSAYSFYAVLRSQADSTVFVSNATLATGDVKVSIDGAAFSDISILPVVTPAGALKQILVSMTTDNMDGDNIGILWSDAAGAQWMDRYDLLQTRAGSTSSFKFSTDSVGLKAITHSGATVGVSNLVGDFSAATVRISGGTATGVVNKVDLRAGEYSDVSVRVGASGIYAASFQAGAIDAAALAAMELSDVTVRITPMAYSGLTVEVNNLVGAFSAATVRISGGTATGVTNRVLANVDQLNGVAPPILRLLSHISSVVTGQASAGSLAVNAMTSDVAEATNDHFNGRVIIFTTGALLGQATSINTSGGYIGASNGSSRFHFPALTEVPTAGDEFLIV